MLYSSLLLRSISPSGALALEKKALENGLHSNQGPTLSSFYVVNKNIHYYAFTYKYRFFFPICLKVHSPKVLILLEYLH